MANRSLNQVRQGLEAFARAHPQIQTVAFNPQEDLLDRGDIKYPAFYYTLLPGARKVGNLLEMQFRMWVSDMMLKENENEAEIWSDTMLIACDLLAYMDGDDRDYALTDGVDIRNFTEASGDNTAGVMFDVTLRMPFPYEKCADIVAGPDFNEDFNEDFLGGIDTDGGPDFNDDFNEDFSGGVGAPSDDHNEDFNNDYS